MRGLVWKVHSIFQLCLVVVLYYGGNKIRNTSSIALCSIILKASQPIEIVDLDSVPRFWPGRIHPGVVWRQSVLGGPDFDLVASWSARAYVELWAWRPVQAEAATVARAGTWRGYKEEGERSGFGRGMGGLRAGPLSKLTVNKRCWQSCATPALPAEMGCQKSD